MGHTSALSTSATSTPIKVPAGSTFYTPKAATPATAAPAASGSSPWLSSAGPIASMISTIGDTYATSEAQKAQAAYAEGMYNVNARFAEVQAEDSIARGEFQADEVLRRSTKAISIIRAKGKQVAGSQRAAFAAQGIESTSGSAADILSETELLSGLDQSEVQRSAEIDTITIKNNAWREAWGYKTQAQIYGAQGRIALLAGNTASRNTLLTGGLKGLGYGLEGYAKYKKAA